MSDLTSVQKGVRDRLIVVVDVEVRRGGIVDKHAKFAADYCRRSGKLVRTILLGGEGEGGWFSHFSFSFQFC